MRRRLVIAAVVLLAGAVVNVAVAWGCAVSYQGETTTVYTTDATDDDVWPTEPPPGLVFEPNAVERLEAPGAGCLVISKYVDVGVVEYVPQTAFAMFLDVGWPLRCLAGEMWARHHAARGRTRIAFRTAVDGNALFGIKSPARPLPYRPLWPGLVVNTLFYAVLLWFVICGPFSLRRFIRLRRGLCPACAYPMGGAPVCTECGHDLSASAAT